MLFSCPHCDCSYPSPRIAQMLPVMPSKESAYPQVPFSITVLVLLDYYNKLPGLGSSETIVTSSSQLWALRNPQSSHWQVRAWWGPLSGSEMVSSDALSHGRGESSWDWLITFIGCMPMNQSPKALPSNTNAFNVRTAMYEWG